MKKSQSNQMKAVLNSFIQPPTPSPSEEPSRDVEEEKFLQPYEQTGEELENTLSPEVQHLLQLRRGRPRYMRQDKNYVRTSFVLNAAQLEKLRAIAQKENVTLKAVVEEAFKKAIDNYEAKNGELALATLSSSAAGLFSE